VKQKLLQWTFGLASSIALLLLIVFNVGIVWVATGPRPLTQYLPYIEKQIASVQNQFTVTIGDGVLLWDGWEHPFDVRLKDVRVATRDGIAFASFPEVSVGADVLAMLTGRFMPNSVRLVRPSLVLERQLDGSLTFGFGQEYKAKISTPDKPFTSPDDTVAEYGLKKAFSFLDQVEIRDATLLMTDLASNKTLTVRNASMEANRDFYHISAMLRAQFSTDETAESAINAQVSIPLTSLAAHIEARLTAVHPSVLSFISPALSKVEKVHVPISGTVDMRLNEQGMPESGNAKLTLGKGEVRHDVLEMPLAIDSGGVDVRLYKQALELRSVSLITNKRRFDAKGKIWQTDAGTGLQLVGNAYNVPVDDVRHFWPKPLAPMTREWVTSNISHGMIPQASVVVNLKPGEFAQPVLPDASIDAKVQLENAQVQYKPEHPKVVGIKGVVHVNAKSLTVNIAAARAMEATQASNGTVFIDDLNIENPRITVKFNANAPAADVAKFLALPDLNLAAPLNVTADSLKGSINGKVSVGFDYFAPRDERGQLKEDELVDIAIDAALVDVSAKQFLKRFDLSRTNGQIHITNDDVKFSGSAQAFSSALTADVQHQFASNETLLKLNGTVDVPTLENLGYRVKDKVSGTLGVQASITQTDVSTKTEGVFDLANAALTLKDVNWSKAASVPATLRFTSVEGQGDVVEVPSLELTLKDEHVKGSAAFGGASQELVAFSADTFKLGRNNLKVNYEPITGGYRLMASGEVLDLQGYLETEREQGTSLKHFPALDLKVDAAKAYLAHGVVASQVKATAQCDVVRCSAASISGTTDGGKAFSFRIEKTGGKRTLAARSEDAGTFLKGLDIYKNMTGGVLSLDGAYADAKASAPLSGNLIINTYRIKNAGALAKILTLASFTGILDTLQGNEGIEFDRMRGKYTLVDDVVTVSAFKSVGSSLGLIVDEGTIALKEKRMDIKGTVVPSYTLNSALRNVPLVGDILTGGEGIIAAVFTMRGATKDPDVNVNPLSVLTPGFLRGIFE
jgi:hypothetical protein